MKKTISFIADETDVQFIHIIKESYEYLKLEKFNMSNLIRSLLRNESMRLETLSLKRLCELNNMDFEKIIKVKGMIWDKEIKKAKVMSSEINQDSKNEEGDSK